MTNQPQEIVIFGVTRSVTCPWCHDPGIEVPVDFDPTLEGLYCHNCFMPSYVHETTGRVVMEEEDSYA